MIPPTQGAALGAQHNLRNKRFLNFIDRRRHPAAQPRRPGADRAWPWPRSRRVRSAPNGDLAGVRMLLNGAGDTQPAVRYHTGPDLRGPVVHVARPAARSRPLQRLHDGGRAADRLGLLRAGPRRADRQDEDRAARPAAPTAASSGTWTPTRRTSTRSTSCAPTARRSRRRSATSARPTTARSTPARTRAGAYEYEAAATTCTSTSSTSAPTPQGILHYTVGVRSLAGAGPQTRGVALAPPQLGHRRGLHDVHVHPEEHGRGGGDAGRAPAGRLGVLQQRHLPPVGVGDRHGLDGAPQERARRPRSSASRVRSRSTSRRPRARPRRLGHADGDVGERSDEDACPRSARSADGTRRRHGAGDAGADAGRAGQLRPVHAGPAARTTSPPRRRT